MLAHGRFFLFQLINGSCLVVLEHCSILNNVNSLKFLLLLLFTLDLHLSVVTYT